MPRPVLACRGVSIGNHPGALADEALDPGGVNDVRVEIRAGLVPEALAEVLEVPAGSPSLQVVRRYFGEDRKVFEVSVSEHPAERYTYSIQLRRGWQSGAEGAGSWTT